MAKQSAPRAKANGRPPADDDPLLLTLPTDLRAAYEAARECAEGAHYLCHALALQSDLEAFLPETRETILAHIGALCDAGARYHDAVFAVEPALSEARGKWGPPHLPPVTNQTACVAALEFRQRVLEEIWMVADREGWWRWWRGEALRMDVGKVASNFEAVCRRFRENREGNWPDVRAMIVEIQSEVREAARRRKVSNRPRGPLRERKMEARDKWIYQQCCKGREMPYDTIIAELKRIAPQKGWESIESVQGIRAAAARYAERHGKEPIPNRQGL